MILNVEKFLEKLNNELKNKINKLDKKPKLCTIRIGDNLGAISYEKSIINSAKKIGIDLDINIFDEISLERIINLIEEKNSDKNINGILIFSPVKKLDIEKLFDAIDLKKDVDGQNKKSILNLFKNNLYTNVATTAVATLEYLKSITDLNGKDILIINRSNRIGLPLSILLKNEDATITLAHSKTKNIYDKIRNADIIISAIGKPEYFKNIEIKSDAIIIDLGYSIGSDGKIKGDFKNIFENSDIKYLPSKGGIGKINSNIIFRNTYLNEVKNDR